MNGVLTLSGAVLLGLAASSHCLVMCGGISAALGMAAAKDSAGRVRPPLLVCYQLGRISAYSLAGLLLAGVFAETQMAEVGRLDADPWLRPRGAQLLEQRRVAVPLLEERRLILGLGAVAQRFLQPLELVDERALRRRRGVRRARRVERLTHALEEIELLGDDRRWGAGRHEDLV